MATSVVLQGKCVRDIPTPRLKTYLTDIENELQSLDATIGSWWGSEQQREYTQLSDAGRAAVKAINAEIARRSAAYLHSLVQIIEPAPVDISQEGEATDEPQQ